jgi:hypothetical protein
MKSSENKLKLYCDLDSFDSKWLGNKSEVMPLFPFLEEKHGINRLKKEFLQLHEHARFEELIEHGKDYIELTSIEDCDFVFLPMKWPHWPIIADPFDVWPDLYDGHPYIELARQHGKKVLQLYEDDYSGDLPLQPEDGIILRTSMYRTERKSHEYALPPFRCDRFRGSYIETPPVEPTVGFCGFFGTKDHQVRQGSLYVLEADKRIKTDYIIRQHFWARGVPKPQAVNEHYRNIESNLFTLCTRGSGNFSMRLNEVMSMGRIPIQIDTDMVFPFESEIDWEKHCVMVPGKNWQEAGHYVMQFYRTHSAKELLEIQKSNRKIWEEYLSPLGFIKNIRKAIQ